MIKETQNAKRKTQKILIVNVNWIGDVLFSTPFIRVVREAYPDSYIACLLHPRCTEMLETNPRINEIIIYDEEGSHRSIFGKMKLINLLCSKKFDTAFILHRSFTKALITFLAGIKERVGYSTKNRGALLTRRIEEPCEEAHKVDYFMNIASAVGIEPQNKLYEFFVENDDRAFIEDFFKGGGSDEGGILVAMCPGGNWDPKRWPRENFAKLADMIVEKFNARIVICGAKKDIGLARDIESMMKSKPIIACGQTTLKQLGAIFEKSRLVVANDTGPMHIASAVGANTIALFGPTSPDITGPHGRGRNVVASEHESCDIPCYDFTCKDNRCMSAITVDRVFREAVDILETG